MPKVNLIRGRVADSIRRTRLKNLGIGVGLSGAVGAAGYGFAKMKKKANKKMYKNTYTPFGRIKNEERDMLHPDLREALIEEILVTIMEEEEPGKTRKRDTALALGAAGVGANVGGLAAIADKFLTAKGKRAYGRGVARSTRGLAQAINDTQGRKTGLLRSLRAYAKNPDVRRGLRGMGYGRALAGSLAGAGAAYAGTRAWQKKRRNKK